MASSTQLTTSRPFSRDDLAIRPVSAGDRAALEAIAAQVWDGHDYLPEVFDAWLADPHGLFCVAVLREQVAAVAKLTRLHDGLWWMEGLRVDPAFRGQGLARIMHHYIVNYARRYAPGVVQFTTASSNAAVLKLAVETGFERLAAFAPYGAEATAGPISWQRLDESAADAVWAFLDGLPRPLGPFHIVEERWHAYPLTQARLRARLAAGQVYAWQPEGTLSGVAVLNRPRQPRDDGLRQYVGFIGAEALADAAADLRALAGAEGFDGVSMKAHGLPDVIAPLEAAGYTRRWDNDMLLFSRALSLTAEADILNEDQGA